MEAKSDANRFANQIRDIAEQCLRDQEPRWTDFFDPPELEQARALVSWTTGVRFGIYGGYPQSERCRMVIFPDYYIVETIKPALGFLEITPAAADPLEHRDYLGALTGLGIRREKLGDLLLMERGAQAILAPELVPFVQTELKRVGNVPVHTTLIEPEALVSPRQREKTIRSTVASPRLDAVASLGFGESRTKMAREIKADRVKVNWKPVHNPDYTVNPGDIISIRGRGRMLFQETTGQSKKGRIGVLLIRYL